MKEKETLCFSEKVAYNEEGKLLLYVLMMSAILTGLSSSTLFFST